MHELDPVCRARSALSSVFATVAEHPFIGRPDNVTPALPGLGMTLPGDVLRWGRARESTESLLKARPRAPGRWTIRRYIVKWSTIFQLPFGQ